MLHKQNKKTKKLIRVFFKFIQTELNHINNFNLFIVSSLSCYSTISYMGLSSFIFNLQSNKMPTCEGRSLIFMKIFLVWDPITTF